MVNYGINLNDYLFNLAKKQGIQIEQSYNDEYKDSNRLSEIELRELYKNLKKDIEDLKVKLDKLGKDIEAANLRKQLKVNFIDINNIPSRETRNEIINKKKELVKLRRELRDMMRDINLNYEKLEDAFKPAQEYYGNKNINLQNKEGRELDARTSLGSTNIIYTELKQRFEDAKKKFDVVEKIIDGKWGI